MIYSINPSAQFPIKAAMRRNGRGTSRARIGRVKCDVEITRER